MKNYKQILEAVNRGIQLALDDFDGEEQVQNIKSKQVQNRDYTKEYLDLMKEVVDLGLPSGTLWYKYNLGVNPNQLSKAEDWYGNYYAWGEIEQHKGWPTNKNLEPYDWKNYKYTVNDDALIKYCNIHKYGLNDFTDNLTELLPEDDAVYQNMHHNFKFKTPTKEQFEELLKYTTNNSIENYNGILQLNGRIFVGKNGNQLFIPATGYYEDSKYGDIGSKGYYWTSNLNTSLPLFAYCFYFSKMVFTHFEKRYNGFAIRPVINL